MDFNDAEYVRRTLRGDRSAFDALVRQYHGMVYAVGLARLNHDHDQADELTQEVFLRAWLHLDRLSKPDYFPAWLVQIARNLAADWQRRDRRKSALVQLLAADHPEVLAVPAKDPSPREVIAASLESQELHLSLNQLPADQRELLLLHYGEGLSQSEIARSLGVSPSTVMRRLDNSLNRLRRIYHRDAAAELAARRPAAASRIARTVAVIAAAFLLSPHQKFALAAAAGKPLLLPKFSATSKTLAIGGGGAAVALALLLVANIQPGSEAQFDQSTKERTGRFQKVSHQVDFAEDPAVMRQTDALAPAMRKPTQLLRYSQPKSARKQGTTEVTTAIDTSDKAAGKHEEEQSNSTSGAIAAASSPCATSEEMLQLIREMEKIVQAAQFTYRASHTVFGEGDKTNVLDIEGTVTIKHGRYLIESRQGSPGPFKALLYYDPTTREMTWLNKYGDRPDEQTVITEKNGTSINALNHIYNPLAGLIAPPFGSGPLSNFFAKQTKDGYAAVKCSPETTNSVEIGSEKKWLLRFQPSQRPFFDYMEHKDAFGARSFSKTVVKFSRLNGVLYPSVFLTAGNYKEMGDKRSTSSIEMLKLGDGVPEVKDPFLHVPRSKRFDMSGGLKPGA